MNFITQNFELILFVLTAISGLIYLIDVLWLAKKRKTQDSGVSETQQPWVIHQARSFFPVLLLVLLLRSFIVEPYRIPSGSLKPTLETGDFIVVNKFIYGLRLPVWHTQFLPIKKPQRGDIFVFRFPPNPSVDYIKRVIGIPGDHIVYQDKVLTINGKTMPQKFLSYGIDHDETHPELGSWKVEKREENLNGVKHQIYVRPDIEAQNFDITVPEGKYFAMGDNRDSSSDSRYWGPVPEANIIGEAFCVLVSWNVDTDTVRWSRTGKIIH